MYHLMLEIWNQLLRSTYYLADQLFRYHTMMSKMMSWPIQCIYTSMTLTEALRFMHKCLLTFGTDGRLNILLYCASSIGPLETMHRRWRWVTLFLSTMMLPECNGSWLLLKKWIREQMGIFTQPMFVHQPGGRTGQLQDCTHWRSSYRNVRDAWIVWQHNGWTSNAKSGAITNPTDCLGGTSEGTKMDSHSSWPPEDVKYWLTDFII